jgi:hypothetical protein
MRTGSLGIQPGQQSDRKLYLCREILAFEFRGRDQPGALLDGMPSEAAISLRASSAAFPLASDGKRCLNLGDSRVPSAKPGRQSPEVGNISTSLGAFVGPGRESRRCAVQRYGPWPGKQQFQTQVVAGEGCQVTLPNRLLILRKVFRFETEA